MTKMILSFLLVFSTAAFASSESKSNKYQLNIEGMVCNYCVESIRLRMKKNKEVKDVKINLDEKLVVVITVPGQDISIARLEESIRDTGYVPQNVKKLE